MESAHAEWVREGADNKQTIVSCANKDGDLGWCIAGFCEGTTGEGVSVNVLARKPSDSRSITQSSLDEALPYTRYKLLADLFRKMEHKPFDDGRRSSMIWVSLPNPPQGDVANPE